AGDRAVIAISVLMTGNPERFADSDVGQDGGILDRLNETRPKSRRGDAEDYVAHRQMGSKWGLGNRAAGRGAAKAHDGVKIMYAAVQFEPDLTNRPIWQNESTHVHVLPRGCFCDLRIRHRTRTAHGRRRVTAAATIQVEARPKSLGYRIDFSKLVA